LVILALLLKDDVLCVIIPGAEDALGLRLLVGGRLTTDDSLQHDSSVTRDFPVQILRATNVTLVIDGS
jgi:hypothetical protein